MRKTLAGIITALLMLQGTALADSERSAILIEETTGRVLYEHNASL